MSPSLVRNCAWLTAWGFTLMGTLSIANVPGNWGHSVCGAWGCGPPLQALLACHASWLVVLIPAAIGIRRFFTFSTQRRIAVTALILTLMIALGVGVYEYLTWLPRASEWQREYFGNRVGFVILTTVELPLFEVGGLAGGVWMGSLLCQPIRAMETIEGAQSSKEELQPPNPALP